jgi:quercetin dioxygenase-like cupin family protein
MKYDGTNYHSLPEREVFKGFHGRFVHTGTMTLAYWKADANSAVPEHHHVHTQIVQLISGELQLTIGGEQHSLHAGDVVVVPSNVPHSALSVTDCVIHDIFIPEREDYK